MNDLQYQMIKNADTLMTVYVIMNICKLLNITFKNVTIDACFLLIVVSKSLCFVAILFSFSFFLSYPVFFTNSTQYIGQYGAIYGNSLTIKLNVTEIMYQYI